MHLHIFLAGDNVSLEQLRGSSLASARLRIVPAADAALRRGFTISIGDVCPAITTTALVGKIGAANISKRQDLWLKQIRALEAAGHKAILDYTDHHLETQSVMRDFYEQSIKACSETVTPTSFLTDALATCDDSKTYSTVHDLLEYPVVEPANIDGRQAKTGVWFGHPSNAQFLAQFIDEHSALLKQQHLMVVSSEQTISILKRYRYKNTPSVSVKFIAWSMAAVLNAAKSADYCIIPSDTASPKRFASNNRLITALALGLPTIATPIPSYTEYSDFFTSDRAEQIKALIKDPSSMHNRLKEFQANHASKFSAPAIMHSWVNVLV